MLVFGLEKSSRHATGAIVESASAELAGSPTALLVGQQPRVQLRGRLQTYRRAWSGVRGKLRGSVWPVFRVTEKIHGFFPEKRSVCHKIPKRIHNTGCEARSPRENCCLSKVVRRDRVLDSHTRDRPAATATTAPSPSRQACVLHKTLDSILPQA